jgi:GTP-binding protein HflX
MGKEQKSVFISAKNKVNFNEFKSLVYEEVKKIHVKRFPFNDFLFPADEENWEEAD